MAAENRKVLLVIDNCPAHSKTDRHLKATELLYLPPNATCKLQPCDQGVIQNLKVHFRKLLLTKVIRHIDVGADAADFQIPLLDALSDLKLAWDMVTASTVKNCFRTACFAVDEDSSRKCQAIKGKNSHQQAAVRLALQITRCQVETQNLFCQGCSKNGTFHLQSTSVLTSTS